MKILVVDDDRRMRELVHYNLKLDGHEVVLCASAPETIRLALAEKPDLILLDVMMPEMDGYDVLLALKKEPATQAIPVFMLTAKGQLGDMDKALRLGAEDYITKPFDPEKLGKMVAMKHSRATTSRLA